MLSLTVLRAPEPLLVFIPRWAIELVCLHNEVLLVRAVIEPILPERYSPRGEIART